MLLAWVERSSVSQELSSLSEVGYHTDGWMDFSTRGKNIQGRDENIFLKRGMSALEMR